MNILEILVALSPLIIIAVVLIVLQNTVIARHDQKVEQKKQLARQAKDNERRRIENIRAHGTTEEKLLLEVQELKEQNERLGAAVAAHHLNDLMKH